MSRTRAGVIAARRRAGIVAVTYIGAGAIGSATGGANPSLGYPGSLQADDFIWVPITASVATAWGTNAASGFTRHFTTDAVGTAPTLAGFYKWATGSESGSVSFTSPGGVSVGQMLCYRNVDKNNPFDATDADFQSSAATTAYTIPSQDASVAGVAALLAADGNSTSGSWNALTNYTEILDGGNGNAQILCIEHRLNIALGATGTRSLVRSGSVKGCGRGILLKPRTA